MFIKVSVPGQFRLKMMPSFRSFLMHRDGEVHYIGGTDILPAPFDSVREAEVLRKFGTSEDKEARSALIEHNLRLVVYIARKFDNTSVGVEDLISIGTIGLIKAINTFDVDKNIKLATYASRCIENEILMYLRRNNKTKLEVSIDEPLNVDWDGTELLAAYSARCADKGGVDWRRCDLWIGESETQKKNIQYLLCRVGENYRLVGAPRSPTRWEELHAFLQLQPAGTLTAREEVVDEYCRRFSPEGQERARGGCRRHCWSCRHHCWCSRSYRQSRCSPWPSRRCWR